MLISVPLLSKLFGFVTGSAAVRRVSPREAFDLQQHGWVVIDVRTPAEFAGGHAAGALNVPLNELSEAAVTGAAGSKKLLMICQGGVRSQTACTKLEAAHDLETASVDGGTNGWLRDGLPIEGA